MKKLINKIKVISVYLLDIITPKDDNLIIFSSNGGNTASGHPRAMFNYISKNHPNYKMYFIMTKNGYTGDLPKESVLYINSLTTALIFIKARYLIGSHILRDFRPFMFSKRKIYLQTWHGVSFKKTFFSMGDVLNPQLQAPKKHLKLMEKFGKRISLFLSPSEFITATMCRAFNIDSRKFITTGLPGIDEMIESGKKNILSKIYPDIKEYDKVILYATTFRRDAKVTKTYPIKYFPFDDMDFDDLDNYLEDNKIIILIRDHLSTSNKSDLNRKRVLSLNTDICPDIHDFYPETDLLITDWGSVSYEFYPMRKPVIHLLYDEEEYLKSPGIHIDDNDFWRPGPRPKTYKDFKASISNSLFVKDEYLGKRDLLYKQMFSKQDGKSAKRAFDLMRKFR